MSHSYPRRKLRNLNARQRKKICVGEFQVLSFSISGEFAADQTGQFGSLLQDLSPVLEAAEIHVLGGGSDADFMLTFEHARSGIQISEQQRQDLINWFAARAEIGSLQASALLDAFYADEAAYEQYETVKQLISNLIIKF